MSGSMRRKQAIAKFETACDLLREISEGGYELYVANTTLHLMCGPSHTQGSDPRPLQGNIIASASAGIRISGGDW